MRTGGPARSAGRPCRGMRIGSPVFGIQLRIPKFSVKCFGVESGLPPISVNLQADKSLWCTYSYNISKIYDRSSDDGDDGDGGGGGGGLKTTFITHSSKAK